MRRILRRKELTPRQIRLAESARFLPFDVAKFRELTSWAQVTETAMEAIREREIEVVTKRRGLKNWREWSESATMLPTEHGPMLLPWDWERRPLRSRGAILWHEIGHHEQDRQLMAYEAMWIEAGWRWALETACYGLNVWCLVLSRKFRRDSYSEADLARWIDDRAATIRRDYRLRRYSASQIRSATKSALEQHAQLAKAKLHPGDPPMR